MTAMQRFLRKDATRSVLSSLISILIGMLAGSLLILIVGLSNPNLGIKSVWDAVRLVFAGLFSTGRNSSGAITFGFNPVTFGNMLFRSMPLMMTGLSVALAYKTGLFNIGAPGQYLMGTMTSLIIALSLPTGEGNLYAFRLAEGAQYAFLWPKWLVWTLALLGGMLAGGIWGSIPGLLKSLLNINEVISCIMTNWIAANVVTWVFDISNLKNMVEGSKSAYVYKTIQNGVATPKLGLDKLFPGSQVNAGILVAVLICILAYILMNRTTFGFQLKACGSNRFAARYAGISDKRNIVLSMAIAGAVSGAGAALYYLSGDIELFWSTYQSLPAIGFNGIPVALLALCNPIGVIFAGLFMSMLDIIGMQITNLTVYNEYITDVITAAIVYLSAFALAFKLLITKMQTNRDNKVHKQDKADENSKKEAVQ